MTIKSVLPKTLWVVDVPNRPEDLAKRWHNKYAKDALRETMEKWWGHESGFKKHFRRDARQRYNHFPRSTKYLKYKARRHGTIDLVYTGASKRRMLTYMVLKVGGTANDSTLRATMTLDFDFKGGTGRFREGKETTRQAFTISKMRTEIQRFDEEDPRLLSDWFLYAYMRKVETHRATRKRIRIPKS